MATNRELAEQANALAKKLNVSVETEGFSSDQLSELIAKMQRQADAQADAPRRRETKPEPKPEQPKGSQAQGHVVAPGQSLIVKGVVVGPGTEINEADVGQETLDHLVKRGLVVTRELVSREPLGNAE